MTVGPEPSVLPSRETGVWGTFGGCMKGVRYRFALQDRTWDFPCPLDLGARPLCRRLRGRGCANCQSLPSTFKTLFPSSQTYSEVRRGHGWDEEGLGGEEQRQGKKRKKEVTSRPALRGP